MTTVPRLAFAAAAVVVVVLGGAFHLATARRRESAAAVSTPSATAARHRLPHRRPDVISDTQRDADQHGWLDCHSPRATTGTRSRTRRLGPRRRPPEIGSSPRIALPLHRAGRRFGCLPRLLSGWTRHRRTASRSMSRLERPRTWLTSYYAGSRLLPDEPTIRADDRRRPRGSARPVLRRTSVRRRSVTAVYVFIICRDRDAAAPPGPSCSTVKLHGERTDPARRSRARVRADLARPRPTVSPGTPPVRAPLSSRASPWASSAGSHEYG